jgi:hypothetical protein
MQNQNKSPRRSAPDLVAACECKPPCRKLVRGAGGVPASGSASKVRQQLLRMLLGPTVVLKVLGSYSLAAYSTGEQPLSRTGFGSVRFRVN